MLAMIPSAAMQPFVRVHPPLGNAPLDIRFIAAR
jgi:hypothetical protein